MVTEEQLRDVINQYMQAWTEGNRQQLIDLFAEDGEFTDPVGTEPIIGRNGIAEFWVRAHPDDGRTITHRPEKVVICANEAILKFVIEVRHPDNKGMNITAFDHFIVNDEGKIQSGRAFWDESCIEQPEGMDLLVPDLPDA
jgi:steroid delta-isomerase